MTVDPWMVMVLLALGAALYASVGHGGASAYLAIMSLVGLTPGAMRPTALVLNLGVSALASWRFRQAGHFQPKLFRPLAAGSVPGALLGGWLRLPPEVYTLLLGGILVYAAVQVVMRRSSGVPVDAARLPIFLAAGIGFGIGLISGMVGVGGGIFLSPLLVLAGWADVRQAAGISAPFILVNSLAGLAGQWQRGVHLQPEWAPWLAAVLAGGAVGAELGSRKLSPAGLKWLLAAVLFIAGGKLLRAAF